AGVRRMYQAGSAAEARARLEEFDRGSWGRKYPAIAQSWRRNWEQVIPFFAFAPEVRTILYTTNAIESLNAQVRKAVRVRGHFPSEEAASKLIWCCHQTQLRAAFLQPSMNAAVPQNHQARPRLAQPSAPMQRCAPGPHRANPRRA